MSSSESEALQALEEKTTYLERHIEAQDRELLRLWNTIEKWGQDLQKLQSRVESGGGGETPIDEKPPHY